MARQYNFNSRQNEYLALMSSRKTRAWAERWAVTQAAAGRS